MSSGEGMVPLENVNAEKDLGILTDNELTFKAHMAEKIQKANRIVGLIRRSFHFLDTEMFSTLYKSLVRPILEYGSPVWSPEAKGSIIDVENVQRRATKLVDSLSNLSYEERMKILNLPSLEYRRVRGRMIETYKILHNYYDFSFPWLTLESDAIPKETTTGRMKTRGSALKLHKEHKKTPAKRKVFSYQVVNDWNTLPHSVTNAATLNSFKNGLDKFWAKRMYSYTEYGK